MNSDFGYVAYIETSMSWTRKEGRDCDHDIRNVFVVIGNIYSVAFDQVMVEIVKRFEVPTSHSICDNKTDALPQQHFKYIAVIP